MATTYNYYYIGDNDRDFVKNPVLLTFSKMKNGPAEEMNQHSHTYTEIFVFESGKGVFECGKNVEQISAGDAIIVKAGVKHIQISYSEPLTYYCYAVNDLFGDNAFPSDNGYLYLSGDKTAKVLSINEQCRTELEKDNAYKISVVSALVKMLVAEILRNCDFSLSQPSESDSSEIKHYLQNHYDEDITLESLCKIFYTNKNTLLHNFKKNNGVSPLRYLNLYRVEMAKKMLSNGSNVTETAIAVGFSNPVYFAEIFKKSTGLTPSTFKRFARSIKNRQG